MSLIPRRGAPSRGGFTSLTLCETLEERTLLSVSTPSSQPPSPPLDTPPSAEIAPESAESTSHSAAAPREAAVTISGGSISNQPRLTDGQDGNRFPTSDGHPTIVVGEDDNNTTIHLTDYFADLDQGSSTLQYTVTLMRGNELFDEFVFNSATRTVMLDFAADAAGEALLHVIAVDSEGLSTSFDVTIIVVPQNDRPTTTGIADIDVLQGETSTVIDLFAAFDDVEDPDQDLVFTVTDVTNPNLFASLDLNHAAGTLTLQYAAGATGSADLTIRATDTGGAFVEMSTAGSDFKLYDRTSGELGIHKPDTELLGLSPIELVSGWWLWEIVNGQYVEDHLNRPQLEYYLENVAPSDGTPIVFNIENDVYINTPEGRDLLAEVMAFVHEIRPDIPLTGFYRLVPGRSWHWPISHHLGVQDTNDNLLTFYSQWTDNFTASYNGWLDTNSLFRTEPLSSNLGGGTLADLVTIVNPSLYTFYHEGFVPYAAGSSNPVLREPVTFNGTTNVVTLQNLGYGLADGVRLRIRTEIDGELPEGLQTGQEYYVVDYDQASNSFQLSESFGGPAIDFGDTSSGSQFIYATDRGNPAYDPAIGLWSDYADYNVAEARKFNVPVVPWISPTFKGVGVDYLEKNVFRDQLDTLFEISDGIAIYNPASTALAAAADPANHGWWEAVEEFMAYLNTPTQFAVTITPAAAAASVPAVGHTSLPPAQESLTPQSLRPLNDPLTQLHLLTPLETATQLETAAQLDILYGRYESFGPVPLLDARLDLSDSSVSLKSGHELTNSPHLAERGNETDIDRDDMNMPTDFLSLSNFS